MAPNETKTEDVELHEDASSGEEDADEVVPELTEEQKRVAEAMGHEHIERVAKQSRSEKKVGSYQRLP